MSEERIPFGYSWDGWPPVHIVYEIDEEGNERIYVECGSRKELIRD